MRAGALVGEALVGERSIQNRTESKGRTQTNKQTNKQPQRQNGVQESQRDFTWISSCHQIFRHAHLHQQTAPPAAREGVCIDLLGSFVAAYRALPRGVQRSPRGLDRSRAVTPTTQDEGEVRRVDRVHGNQILFHPSGLATSVMVPP